MRKRASLVFQAHSRQQEEAVKHGEVAEWTKAVDSKSTVGQPTVGSNPTLSAPLSCVSAELCFLWRGDRVDEGARLERVCRATYRGFESHSLRQFYRVEQLMMMVGSR